MKVRIKFTKYGVVKYIGHLDLMRYFQKAFRRTDIQIIYSKGFSPHMLMSFASPLGVGIEGYGEYFDVEVADSEDYTLIKDKLNATMAEGIEILDVVLLPDSAGNAMASVEASDYELEFHKENPLSEELLNKYKKADSVIFVKELKSGPLPVNVKDLVYDIKLIKDNVLFARVNSSSADNLRPAALLTALLSLEDKDLNDYPYHTLRREIYRKNKQGELVPMGDVND